MNVLADTQREKLQIGIIGYGDFTKVMIEYLAPYADIIVSSRSRVVGDAGYGARFGSVDDVLARPIIIPSIPAQFFRTFFESHHTKVNANALVIDVASVKTAPLVVLKELLPATCQIIGTHPMFGPASIEKNGGVAGLKCVVSPVRAGELVMSRVVEFLRVSLGLVVIWRTPEEHDKEMAYIQGLSHYIGRVMDEMSIPESDLATLAYDDLMSMKHIQGGDSWDLFHSIMHENPYAKEVHAAFLTACRQLDRKLFD